MRKNFSTGVLIAIGLVLATALVFAARLGKSAAATDKQAVATANRLFETARYAESARVLEQLVDQGIRDSAVYYNLGNAYLMQGDAIRALANYEQATRLAPRDKDIRANLALAQQQVQTISEQDSGGFLLRFARLTSSWVSVDEAPILLIGLWFGFGYLLFASRLARLPARRTGLRLAALVSFVCVLLLGLSYGSRVYLDRTPPDRIQIPAAMANIDTQ
jgi:tetratricopeptide (TPR) repeat protein